MIKDIIFSLFVGVASAAQMVSVNLLVIRATINRGFRLGLLVGGAATAAAVLIVTAIIFSFLPDDVVHAYQLTAVPFVGLAVIVCGIAIARAPGTAGPKGLWRFGLTGLLIFAVVLAYPVTFSEYSSFVQYELEQMSNPGFIDKVLVIWSIAKGIGLWWVLLCWGCSRIARRFNELWLRRINRGLGVLVAALGFVWLSLWFI